MTTDRAIGIDGKPSELKSLINNDGPLNEIIRARYLYRHPRAPVHIIATFTMQFDEDGNRLESIAEWSQIQDNDGVILIEDQISLISEFDIMVKDWIKEDDFQEIICR